MKLTRSLRSSYRGSVLLITITVVAISAIVLGSYFTLVQYQTASVARSQAWNASIAMTESGIEEGMALINRNTGGGIITAAWAWTAGTASDGWTAWSNNTTTLTRYMVSTNAYGIVSSNYYTAIVTNDNGSPLVSAVGYVPHTSIPWVFGSEKYLGFLTFPMRPFLAQAGVTTSSSAGATVNTVRKVQVTTSMDALFTMGLVAKDTIDLNGNGVTTDSFNSRDPNFSTLVTNVNFGTNWVYDESKRRDKGDIGANSALVDAVGVGNANIWGKLHTGPGSQSTTASIGPNGKVGDAAWQAGGSSGFQPGSWLYDMNVTLPDVPPPPTGGLPPLPGSYKGTSYSYILNSMGSGKYEVSGSIGGKICVTGSNVVLWAKGGLNFSGNGDGIFIAPGASLIIYVGNTTGSSVTMNLTGKGGINANGYAKNCQIYGLPNCTSISMSGNAAFVGTIYAPNANMSGSGGGNNNLDSMGAIIVKTVTLNGHWNFHYDESLKGDGPLRGWIAKNWSEVKIN